MAIPRSTNRNPESLVRLLVRHLHAYVPGEQPKIPGLVKLNTNENPYPPSAKVLAAVKAAADDRLRLYPNPTADCLRQKLARLHRCQPENLIVGNGSDELLALATRAFERSPWVHMPVSQRPADRPTSTTAATTSEATNAPTVVSTPTRTNPRTPTTRSSVKLMTIPLPGPCDTGEGDA